MPRAGRTGDLPVALAQFAAVQQALETDLALLAGAAPAERPRPPGIVTPASRPGVLAGIATAVAAGWAQWTAPAPGPVAAPDATAVPASFRLRRAALPTGQTSVHVAPLRGCRPVGRPSRGPPARPRPRRRPADRRHSRHPRRVHPLARPFGGRGRRRNDRSRHGHGDASRPGRVHGDGPRPGPRHRAERVGRRPADAGRHPAARHRHEPGLRLRGPTRADADAGDPARLRGGTVRRDRGAVPPGRRTRGRTARWRALVRPSSRGCATSSTAC